MKLIKLISRTIWNMTVDVATLCMALILTVVLSPLYLTKVLILKTHNPNKDFYIPIVNGSEVSEVIVSPFAYISLQTGSRIQEVETKMKSFKMFNSLIPSAS